MVIMQASVSQYILFLKLVGHIRNFTHLYDISEKDKYSNRFYHEEPIPCILHINHCVLLCASATLKKALYCLQLMSMI